MEKECYGCDFNDPDYGCTCPPGEEWYACGLSNPTEEDFTQPTDTCVTCENFIGGGDWGLCCKIKYGVYPEVQRLSAEGGEKEWKMNYFSCPTDAM